MSGKILLSINDESNILERVPDHEIWYSLLGYYPEVTIGKISNPFRTDNKPSAAFLYNNKHNKLVLYDHSTNETLDSLQVYKKYKGLSKEEVSSIFRTKQASLSDISYITPKTKVNTSWEFTVTKGNWTKERFNYWEDYLIEKEILNELHCYYATKVYGRHINQCDYRLVMQNCYYYQFDTKYKLYSPNGDPKWLTNTSSKDVFGLDSLVNNDLLIITSSGKDVAALRSLFKRNNISGNVIAPQNEGLLVKQLSDIDYKRLLLWYDNDNPGIKFMEKHSIKYNCEYLIQPTIYKDPSDWIKAEGELPILNFIHTWI
jgi:hypothetical protein